MKWLTYFDSNYKAIAEMTVPIMQKYCSQYEIDFTIYTEITSSYSDVYWNKIAVVEKELPNSEWIVWCDADILIRDLSFNIYNIIKKNSDKNLLISSDYKGLCLGFFIIRNCKWSKDLLYLMQELGNIRNEKIGVYDVKNQREQDTMKVLYDFFENINTKTFLFPENIISNPRSVVRNDKSFAHHFWANNKVEQVALEIKSLIDTV